jgi:adhesin transport system outer membrane protein
MNGLRKSLQVSLRSALLGSVFAFVSIAGAQATSLEDAVKMTLATNPDIGIVAHNREATDEELRQARGLYFPSLDAGSGIGKERTDDEPRRLTDNDGRWLTRFESSLNLTQGIFTGFERHYTVERDKARVESAASRVFENSEFIAFDAVGIYYEVLRQRELVDLADNNVKTHMNIVGSIREQIAGGGGSSADLAQAEARLYRARATLADILRDLRDSEAFYTRIVGQFPDDLNMPEYSGDILPGDLNQAVGWVNDNSPTVRIFEADVRTTEAEVGLTESAFYPQVNLELETEYNDGRDGVNSYEWNSQAMVRMRWNLFRGGIDRANRQEALARMSEAKSRRYQSLVDSQEDMRTSWFELEASKQRVEDLTAAVQFNIATRDAYVEQFDVAQRTLLDVLDAENELFVSRGQLVTAEVTEIVAGYRILALGGQLLATLSVSAPEQAVVDHKTWNEAVGLSLE